MSDDIKEWLQKVAATDPFVKLRKFKQDNPEKKDDKHIYIII